jgi:hypothetical protein
VATPGVDANTDCLLIASNHMLPHSLSIVISLPQFATSSFTKLKPDALIIFPEVVSKNISRFIKKFPFGASVEVKLILSVLNSVTQEKTPKKLTQ